MPVLGYRHYAIHKSDDEELDDAEECGADQGRAALSEHFRWVESTRSSAVDSPYYKRVYTSFCGRRASIYVMVHNTPEFDTGLMEVRTLMLQCRGLSSCMRIVRALQRRGFTHAG